MVTPHTNQDIAETKKMDETYHLLSDKWTLWAHLPHDTDWRLESYKKIYTGSSVEQMIAIMETLPDVLVKNCMLFLMREGINPIWEDVKNRNGGCFSYKIPNKIVYSTWKKLSYVVAGGSVCNNNDITKKITGITISPKKNFCIIKIWLEDCLHQNPSIIINEIEGIVPQGCLFKKHAPEY